MPDKRFVVTRPYPESGIGSNLVSLAGAVWLAGRLDRDVIVDWRNSNFLRDKSANLFTEFLEPVGEIQGVPMHYAEGAQAAWDVEGEATGVRILDPSEASRVTRDSEEPYLVLTPFHAYDRIEPRGDPFERFRRLRVFFASIAPREFLRNEIDDFLESNRFHDSFVIAVNIATGNGDYRKGSPSYGRVKIELFDHEQRFMKMMAYARTAALRRLPQYLRDRAVTFVATDDAHMRELLLQLPNAVTRRSVFPPRGAGRSFADYDVPGYTDREAFADIVVDHFLLARCHAIVRNPSMFGTYGLVMTNFYNGNLRNVETLSPGYVANAVLRRVRAAPSHLRRNPQP